MKGYKLQSIMIIEITLLLITRGDEDVVLSSD